MSTVRGKAVLAFCWISGLSALVLPGRPALACGWVEAPSSCAGDTGAADEARWMLKRVVAAVEADEPKALDAFTRGADGFRTQDTYVFCISAEDGRMVAHPDPKLRGQDARSLRDPNGKAFIVEMLDVAKLGQSAKVSYLFPRPGSTVPVPKTSFVTRVKDLVCGVGYYTDDNREGSAAPAAPADRVTELRRHLGAGMPESLRADWTAYLAAIDAQNSARDAALAKARESVHAAEAALDEHPRETASQ
jgi:hypothetical protein